MADKERVDSDYDGPISKLRNKLRKEPPQDSLPAASKRQMPREYDLIIVVLTDGTELAHWIGEYYHLDSDGAPDFSRPVDAKVVEEDRKKALKEQKSGGDSANR